jgi:hypothetical protein
VCVYNMMKCNNKQRKKKDFNFFFEIFISSLRFEYVTVLK